MAALRAAEVGAPILARAPEGAPAFWIVPLTAEKRAAGFARVELNGHVAQIGRFGDPADERTAGLAADFFEGPPMTVMNEIRARHSSVPFSHPQLSYDGSPAKWAWLVKIGDPATRLVFVTPGGWYERPTRDGEASAR
jgi:hypothetical protein